MPPRATTEPLSSEELAAQAAAEHKRPTLHEQMLRSINPSAADRAAARTAAEVASQADYDREMARAAALQTAREDYDAARRAEDLARRQAREQRARAHAAYRLELGERLRDLRAQAGLSQAKMAAFIPCLLDQVKRLESTEGVGMDFLERAVARYEVAAALAGAGKPVVAEAGDDGDGPAADGE
jgi:hypothetical protein